jgi:DMSO/TMAO reductase YedYZ molybdopterin-dependent catalytic subunit
MSQPYDLTERASGRVTPTRQDLSSRTARWTKLDRMSKGVSVDALLEAVSTEARYLTVWSDGGYTTNLGLEDVTDGEAWVAYEFGGEPLESEHGGSARLLVPHLHFWTSAKWVRGLSVTADDEPGFWESYGYHNHGDTWLEQRYQRD